jgi:enoyl-CoA hydratase/carnithine racemase
MRGLPDPLCTHLLDSALLRFVDGLMPAQALVDDLAGEPALLRIEGDWRGVGDAAADFLADVPLATLAVGPAPDAVAAACDLATDDPVEADRWCSGFARAPHAALAAALLVRHPPAGSAAGLVAESTAYSLLQAGPEFRSWLATRQPHPVADQDSPRVRVERDGPIVEVVLDRPDRHNALDVRMRDELCAALATLAPEPDTVIVARGNGASFCSGGDLDDFGTAPGPVESHALRLARSPARWFAALAPRLVVGVHGATLGAGIELAAFARTVVAADDARLGLPELALGLLPGAGGTISIPRRAGRRRLLQLLYTGEAVDADTACRWGLVDEVVPRADLPERLRRVAEARTTGRGAAPR